MEHVNQCKNYGKQVQLYTKFINSDVTSLTISNLHHERCECERVGECVNYILDELDKILIKKDHPE